MNEIYINLKDFSKDWIGKYLEKKFNKDLISIEDLLGLIENLVSDVDYLEEKIKDIEQNIEENYRPISVAEQYNVSDFR